jgi:predicted small lipoprotein YifL
LGQVLEPAVASRVFCLSSLTFLALALAGCGRAGQLDPPPGTPANQPTASINTTSTMAGAPNTVGPGAPPAPTGSNANPQPSTGQPFFLDPLVK